MKKTFIRFSLLALASCAAMAQSTSPVVQSVQKAIDGNPEVAAKFNAFRASNDEIAVASGAWKPHLDASAAAGRRAYENTNSLPRDARFYQGGVRLELSQLLWDGLGTHNEIERLGHAKLERWFEFLDATEQFGLEAAKAYYDVVRYRKLVALAEDNYVQHKVSFDQVQSRVNAGVGRGVDLEQVIARVALAESNLVTERANLHDVTERYIRLVGAVPPAENVSAVSMARPLPATETEAMRTAALQSPAVAAAIENLRAARAAVAARKSPFQPRVEARAQGAIGHNLDGVLDQKHDAGAEIAVTWNIFNGGADSARERQYANLLTQAENLRDKACVDTRQTVSVAFNDVRKLGEQLGYLDRNVVSIQKARDAYRQQFDIGQRSLLDLLNSENELYTAKRSYVLAEEDLATAILRTYAGMGTLVGALGLRRPDGQDLAPEAQNWGIDGDASSRCPLESVDVGGATFAQLDARADRLAAERAPAGQRPAAVPALAASAPAPALRDVAAVPEPTAARSIIAAAQRLQEWADAWMSHNADRYLAFYAPEFKPAKGRREEWTAERRRLVGRPGAVKVTLANVQTRALGDTRVETSFDQTYTSPTLKDMMHKTLVWDRVDGQWKIVAESNR
ncbi:MAG: TolC family outer membrane protein [Burkholderiales bacterium]|nr:TolC family outer membrane protein [Burkholderiales bacterium]